MLFKFIAPLVEEGEDDDDMDEEVRPLAPQHSLCTCEGNSDCCRIPLLPPHSTCTAMHCAE